MNQTTPSFEALLHTGAIIVLAVAALWGAAVLVAVLLEALTDGRVRGAARLGCPAGCHRLLLAGATALVAVTLLSPSATADERQAPARSVLDGLSLPDRAPGVTSVAAEPQLDPLTTSPHQNLRAREPPSVSALITVLPGDSLWEISRRLLPADATARSIADLTQTLYAHNRTTIGADPALIRPGQRLYVPPTARETYSEDS